MFYKKDNSGYKKVMDGIIFKTLTHGEKTLLSEFKLSKGVTVPTHDHPHEQTGYLISGKLLFDVEGEKFTADPGDSWNIPSSRKHSAFALEDSVVVEIFSPVREDYL